MTVQSHNCTYFDQNGTDIYLNTAILSSFKLWMYKKSHWIKLLLQKNENDPAENLLTYCENLLTFLSVSLKGVSPSTYVHKNASKLLNYGPILKNLSSMESWERDLSESAMGFYVTWLEITQMRGNAHYQYSHLCITILNNDLFYEQKQHRLNKTIR